MTSVRPVELAGRDPERYASVYEHGNCGLVAFFARKPEAGRASLDRALAALRCLHHRSGSVEGEGDGCGVLTDIPRALWARRLEAAGQDPQLVASPLFAVAHLFVEPAAARPDLLQRMQPVLARWGIEVLLCVQDEVEPQALGPRARANRPQFWQLALRVRPPVSADLWEPFLWDLEGDVSVQAAPARLVASVGSRLFEAAMALEAHLPGVQVVSCSAHTVVYKVRGDVEALVGYYPDLRDPAFETRATIGHNRYSTNTTPTFDRAQPFSLLAHNGEINTIRRLCMEAQTLGVPIVPGGSDSQNLNRTLDALIHRFGFSLPEAMEILFPPIINEVKKYPPEWQDLYMYFRQAWGPFAQGPAAVFARHRHDAVVSVDALGLRPLWYLPAEEFVVMASEPGVVPTGELIDDPKPLSPGEKMAVHLTPQGLEVVEYPELQARIVERWRRRVGQVEGYRRFILAARAVELPSAAADSGSRSRPSGAGQPDQGPADKGPQEEALRRLMEVWAWQNEDVELIEAMAATGAEPIGSLGYDAPLAALSPELHNLADFFKETVAVVTNPAIDREREIEHFSTRVVVGRRPSLVGRSPQQEGRVVELRVPLIPGGWPAGPSALQPEAWRAVAAEWDTLAWDDLMAILPAAVLPMRLRPGERGLRQALARLARQACEAASAGYALVVLDDLGVFADEEGVWIDPHLVVAAVDRALRKAAGLRRRVGLVVRSGALRNLHDLMVCLGLGADAVCPWMMWEQAARAASRAGQDPAEGVSRLASALQKGMEKVISTLGIHELRGYARLFSAIGIKPELLELFEVEGYAASEQAGVGFVELEQDILRRKELLAQPKGRGLVRPFRYYPRIWKVLGQAARGEVPYAEAAARMEALERENPVALRHVLDLRVQDRSPNSPTAGVDPAEVDISIGEHSMPFVIASMSFGSQNEAAYRAYLEAAKRANIVCLNGEGGEIPDLVGRYPKHRGIQVASGRFGVHAEMLNGAWVIEIKIGQGAKPGEGGHLPGRKVSPKVARARNARVGIDLISPSNNHDIYSIEDLAQLIDELKTISPHSRIAVKVPVVPGIGTIAVGIAKAGADIINLSGFDGGTGAARMHALRHVGLPAELGVVESHRALVAAGIRDRVELWADGGMRNAMDVMKMILLGANRVGFGTLAMVAVGCTICRGCQLDTCHVGIATQIETVEEAMRRGLKRFVPRDVELAAQHLAQLLEQMGQALRELTAQLGARRTQDLVGRSDLLVQRRLTDRVDLRELLTPAWEAVPVAAAVRRYPMSEGLAGSSGNGVQQQGQPTAAQSPAVRVVVNPRAHEQLAQARRWFGEGDGHGPLVWEACDASCSDRILATPVAGQLARLRIGLESAGSAIFGDGATHNGTAGPVPASQPSEGDGRARWAQAGARVVVRGRAPVGNGTAAFNVDGVEVHIEGGAQDGVGKCALGGKVVILKGLGANGRRVNGCVGKSFAYGAQRGRFFVQGEADSRAAIRLSGADIVFGAMPRGPVNDEHGNVGCRAQLKGFAFEYMTNGRAVVLGDPGPWICSGMTGGVVYLRLAPELGLDEAALRRRLAKGARVELVPIDDAGEADIRELLGEYAQELENSGQAEEAELVRQLAARCREHFLAVRPVAQQTVQHVSTE